MLFLTLFSVVISVLDQFFQALWFYLPHFCCSSSLLMPTLYYMDSFYYPSNLPVVLSCLFH